MKITGFSPLDTANARPVANPTKSEAMSSSDKASSAGLSGASNASPVKTFSSVALDARAALDAGLQRLGKPADFEISGAQWAETVGLEKLDRRTLYAIASNQGGIFSKAESDAAEYFMNEQVSKAMMAVDPLLQNPAATFKAAIDFYDTASPEEKASLGWAEARAAAEAGYRNRMSSEGRIPENVDSGNPVVQLLVKAYDEIAATNDPSQDIKNMPSYIRAIDLWALQSENEEPFSVSL